MMHPAFSTVRARRRSAGVGLVTAIFLLVVLAGLGVAMVTLFKSQQQGIALDEQGVRAQQAARAGIEWGLFHRLRDTSCSGDNENRVTLGGNVLRDFTVIVRCRQAGDPGVPDSRPASTDTGVNLERWIIRAEACAPAVGGACPARSNNPDYVRRVIEVQI